MWNLTRWILTCSLKVTFSVSRATVSNKTLRPVSFNCERVFLCLHTGSGGLSAFAATRCLPRKSSMTMCAAGEGGGAALECLSARGAKDTA